jgi:hypothetical protein
LVPKRIVQPERAKLAMWGVRPAVWRASALHVFAHEIWYPILSHCYTAANDAARMLFLAPDYIRMMVHVTALPAR